MALVRAHDVGEPAARPAADPRSRPRALVRDHGPPARPCPLARRAGSPHRATARPPRTPAPGDEPGVGPTDPSDRPDDRPGRHRHDHGRPDRLRRPPARLVAGVGAARTARRDRPDRVRRRRAVPVQRTVGRHRRGGRLALRARARRGHPRAAPVRRRRPGRPERPPPLGRPTDTPARHRPADHVRPRLRPRCGVVHRHAVGTRRAARGGTGADRRRARAPASCPTSRCPSRSVAR